MSCCTSCLQVTRDCGTCSEPALSFCPGCGKKNCYLKCNSCQAVLPEGSVFCFRCGTCVATAGANSVDKSLIASRADLLKRVPLMTSCTDDQRFKIASEMTIQKFSDGVSIFHEGDPGNEFYLMIQGTAKVVTFDTNLKHLVEAGRLVAGDYFGETALLRNEKRSATVIATSAVTCMMLRKDQFLDLVKSLPLPFAARRPNLTVTLPARIGDAGGELKRPAKPTHAMTSETRTTILTALSRCPLFSGMALDDRLTLILAMFAVAVPAGRPVVTQGDLGTQLYVVEHGSFAVTQRGADGVTRAVGAVSAGEYFGELALLNSAPRAATVTPTTDSVLWVLDRFTWLTVTKAVGAQKLEQRINFLRRVAFLASLTEFERRRIAEAMDAVYFPPETAIFSKGDAGDAMYVIVNGTVAITSSATPSPPASTPDSVASADAALAHANVDNGVVMPNGTSVTLGSGSYFGELALLYDQPRAASAVTVGEVECLRLDRHTFKLLLGPVVDILESQAVKYGVDATIISRPVSANAAKKSNINNTSAVVSATTGVVSQQQHAVTQQQPQQQQQQYLQQQQQQQQQQYAQQQPQQQQQMQTVQQQLQQVQYTNTAPASNGANTFNAIAINSQGRPIANLSDLEPLATLGKGSFGFVRLVRDRAGNTYALKSVNKQQIVATQQQAHILSEKWVLNNLLHPFIVRLYNTYQTQNKLYFLLEPVLGGELFTFLRQQRLFPEPWVIFYAASVLCTFECMHARSIAYRDLKPENLLLDAAGYLKITDFGFAKEVTGKTWTLCGTPDYLAPEIVASRGHGTAVDWWTLGVLIYEMLAAFPPFYEEDPMTTYTRIVEGRYNMPAHFSPAARAIIASLLEVRASRRLGCSGNGAAAVRAQAFFANFDFKLLLERKIPAPYVPTVTSSTDASKYAHTANLQEEDMAYQPDGSNWDADF